MATTTIRLEESLKSRIAAAAERSGQTAHAFMLAAIEQVVAQAEEDAAFQDLAGTRWGRIAAGGGTIGWEQARAWLEARARGETPPTPPAR